MVDPILSQARIEQMRREGWWRDENLLDYFDAAVKNCPEHIAVVDYRLESDEKNALTYRELNARVTRIALALAHYGVEKQDIVSFQLPGWWEFVAIHLACMRIGAVSNPLMTSFSRARIVLHGGFCRSPGDDYSQGGAQF